MGRIFDDRVTSIPPGFEVTVKALRKDLNAFLANKPYVDFTLQSIKVLSNGRMSVGWTCSVEGDEEEKEHIVSRLRILISDFEWENLGVKSGN